MRPELLRPSAVLVLTLLGTAGIAAAQQSPPAEPQQQQQQEKAQQTPSGKMGKEEPRSHAPSDQPGDSSVFVNGALAVPGAPANTDIVPAKFSEKNANDDKLITLAYTFKLLTDEQRRAIYEGLKGQEAGPAFNADVGVELPSSIELHPVPNDVAARVPQTKDYRYAVADNRVLLSAPVGRFVVGVFMDDPPSTQSGRRTPDALALPVPRMAHAYTQRNRWSAPREYVQAGSRTIASAASAWWLARSTIKYECGTFHTGLCCARSADYRQLVSKRRSGGCRTGGHGSRNPL